VKGLAAILVLIGIWLSGLVAFTDRIARLTPAVAPEQADGIVALTGRSDLRLKAAADLLVAGKARRMLISGVNRQVRRADLLALTRAPKPIFDCCVDLGFTAEDTLGNAREAADWARTMRFHSLILVTADYHMPRALLELRALAPDLAIQAYPLATPELDVRRWSTSAIGARRMMAEYAKYMAILVRDGALSLPPTSRRPA
jgi:uncharacterized SAM-binding protein YcdF (DUF218 family)